MNLKIVFILVLAFFTSCTNQFSNSFDYDDDFGGDCDYSSCDGIEPYFADIYIKFTRNNENPNPKIYLMSGFYENGVVIDSVSTDTIDGEKVIINVNLNYQYTVFIKYVSGENIITAIDGAYVHKSSYMVCDSVCWNVNNDSCITS